MYITAVVSGGLDSTTMLFDLARQHEQVDVISFNYGQRHKKELEQIKIICEDEGFEHDIIDIHTWGGNLTSSLTDYQIAVPEGHYAADNMAVTVVPNRNMTMLAMAAGIALSRKADAIATAVHAGDHTIYPDCRPEFIEALQYVIRIGNDAPTFQVLTPYIYQSKNDIAVEAVRLRVPIEETWSCYKGGVQHCGKCGTCVERLEALDYASKVFPTFKDRTEYEDSHYWRSVIK
jgi:7-cyano-7-deazaguanine synthase